MIKSILFDFNGVIIDDEPIQMLAYQEILGDKGITLSEDDYLASLGMDDRTFVAAAFGRVGKSVGDDTIDEIVLAKAAKWKTLVENDLPLFEGIEGFVE